MSELSQHEQIVQAFNNYLTEAETFEDKGVKAAAARARKALGDLGKLTKTRRAEIQEKKNSM
jgi:N-glycosylase/DNA lyase